MKSRHRYYYVTLNTMILKRIAVNLRVTIDAHGGIRIFMLWRWLFFSSSSSFHPLDLSVAVNSSGETPSCIKMADVINPPPPPGRVTSCEIPAKRTSSNFNTNDASSSYGPVSPNHHFYLTRLFHVP